MSRVPSWGTWGCAWKKEWLRFEGGGVVEHAGGARIKKELSEGKWRNLVGGTELTQLMKRLLGSSCADRLKASKCVKTCVVRHCGFSLAHCSSRLMWLGSRRQPPLICFHGPFAASTI
ncbi:hypothetical protein TIFTF001_028129 [Ficus carica]|uniref:Uncharacterized protein n=1 Tax=Ficus carica TaxID=3494 RepID=A0AA88IZQ3_FICCA|nr:hypothetical protein TIFTF001_028129 [Ficus carica]